MMFLQGTFMCHAPNALLLLLLSGVDEGGILNHLELGEIALFNDEPRLHL